MFRRRSDDAAPVRHPTLDHIRKLLIDSNGFVAIVEAHNRDIGSFLRARQSRLENQANEIENRLNSWLRRRLTRDQSDAVRSNAQAHLVVARDFSIVYGSTYANTVPQQIVNDVQSLREEVEQHVSQVTSHVSSSNEEHQTGHPIYAQAASQNFQSLSWPHASQLFYQPPVGQPYASSTSVASYSGSYYPPAGPVPGHQPGSHASLHSTQYDPGYPLNAPGAASHASFSSTGSYQASFQSSQPGTQPPQSQSSMYTYPGANRRTTNLTYPYYHPPSQ